MQMQFVDELTDGAGAPNGEGRALDDLDRLLTVVFAVELALNMFAQWFWAFWEEGWNWWRRPHVHVHVHVHACLHACMHIVLHFLGFLCIYLYTYAYIHTYIHTLYGPPARRLPPRRRPIRHKEALWA